MTAIEKAKQERIVQKQLELQRSLNQFKLYIKDGWGQEFLNELVIDQVHEHEFKINAKFHKEITATFYYNAREISKRFFVGNPLYLNTMGYKYEGDNLIEA